MAFEGYEPTQRFIRSGRISMTTNGFNFTDFKPPFSRMDFQYDIDTNRIRFFEVGPNEKGHNVITQKRKLNDYVDFIINTAFVRKGILPKGIYRPVEGEFMTYEFESPPLRWRQQPRKKGE